MQEKTLLKLSLITALFGLVILYFISLYLASEPPQDLSQAKAGQEIKIKGRIGKASDAGKVAFLEILNEKIEKTKIVLFKDEEIALKEGDYVEITGTVEDYQGEKEIIGNKVVKK